MKESAEYNFKHEWAHELEEDNMLEVNSPQAKEYGVQEGNMWVMQRSE